MRQMGAPVSALQREAGSRVPPRPLNAGSVVWMALKNRLTRSTWTFDGLAGGRKWRSAGAEMDRGWTIANYWWRFRQDCLWELCMDWIYRACHVRRNLNVPVSPRCLIVIPNECRLCICTAPTAQVVRYRAPSIPRRTVNKRPKVGHAEWGREIKARWLSNRVADRTGGTQGQATPHLPA